MTRSRPSMVVTGFALVMSSSDGWTIETPRDGAKRASSDLQLPMRDAGTMRRLGIASDGIGRFAPAPSPPYSGERVGVRGRASNGVDPEVFILVAPVFRSYTFIDAPPLTTA